jgi:hypothetical protein
MSWSAVPFGEYKGKTFPEIVLSDPDWFFWAVPKLYGKLAEEAQDIARKARAIRIPNPHRKRLQVEYQYELSNRFCGFGFVEPSSARYSRWSTRLPHLDLALPLRRKKYDKRASRIVIRDFRRYFLGEHKRLTKKFFSNDRNFINL